MFIKNQFEVSTFPEILSSILQTKFTILQLSLIFKWHLSQKLNTTKQMKYLADASWRRVLWHNNFNSHLNVLCNWNIKIIMASLKQSPFSIALKLTVLPKTLLFACQNYDICKAWFSGLRYCQVFYKNILICSI